LARVFFTLAGVYPAIQMRGRLSPENEMVQHALKSRAGQGWPS